MTAACLCVMSMDHTFSFYFGSKIQNKKDMHFCTVLGEIFHFIEDNFLGSLAIICWDNGHKNSLHILINFKLKGFHQH